MANPQREFDYYIPPDCPVEDDGTIAADNLDLIYQFNDREDKWLLSFTGMGMPPIEYIRQQGPLQHGETYLDFRLRARIVQFVHRHNGRCSRQNYWNNRGTILNFLRPNRQGVDSFGLGRLRKILPNGDMRDVGAIVQQGPAFMPRNPGVWDEWSFTETIRFVCPDPTFFDPAQETVTWTVDVVDGLLFYDAATAPDHLVFPDTALFASGALSGSASVTYTGTWLTYPTITFTGPVTNPIIENATLGVRIALDYTLVAGEVITVTTAYGNKTIENAAGTNLIGTLTDDSDLDFYIAPAPTAPGGVNVFNAWGGEAILGASEIAMTYHTRYIGI